MSTVTWTQGEVDAAAYRLSELIQEARETHDRNLIRRLRRLWRSNNFVRTPRNGERWKSILRRFDTEGNVWIVWWMDGVRSFLLSRWRVGA